MSGGRWNYENDRAAYELFDWMRPDYGDEGFSKSKQASRLDPLEDKELSELCWDLFCVIHSCDWYKSGDCCEETYRKDVKRFKDKWLGKTQKARVKRQVDTELEIAKENLYKAFGIEEV